jgi:integrase
VLRLPDLDGRVLTIERGLTLEVLGTTKTNRNRRLTLGATTTAMIIEHFDSWRQRVGPAQVVGDWIFAPDFRRLSNARVDLQILKAQARLGHRDPVTTLRHYAHATPLDDLDVADHIDGLLNAATG